MELPKEFKDTIWDYCRVNNIPNIDEFTLKLVKQGFTIECFGATPIQPEPKIVEKIIEVEKIVERVVDRVITDDTETKKLADENYALTKEIVELKLQIKKLKDKKDIYGE